MAYFENCIVTMSAKWYYEYLDKNMKSLIQWTFSVLIKKIKNNLSENKFSFYRKLVLIKYSPLDAVLW